MGREGGGTGVGDEGGGQAKTKTLITPNVPQWRRAPQTVLSYEQASTRLPIPDSDATQEEWQSFFQALLLDTTLAEKPTINSPTIREEDLAIKFFLPVEYVRDILASINSSILSTELFADTRASLMDYLLECDERFLFFQYCVGASSSSREDMLPSLKEALSDLNKEELLLLLASRTDIENQYPGGVECIEAALRLKVVSENERRPALHVVARHPLEEDLKIGKKIFSMIQQILSHTSTLSLKEQDTEISQNAKNIIINNVDRLFQADILSPVLGRLGELKQQIKMKDRPKDAIFFEYTCIINKSKQLSLNLEIKAIESVLQNEVVKERVETMKREKDKGWFKRINDDPVFSAKQEASVSNTFFILERITSKIFLPTKKVNIDPELLGYVSALEDRLIKLKADLSRVPLPE